MPVGWGYNLGDSDEKHFNTLGILTWPYFLILTMGNSNNFVTKVDKTGGMQMILTSNHDPC